MSVQPAGHEPAATIEVGPCPDHGGDPIPPGQPLTWRDCGLPGYPLVALIVDGRAVKHMGPRVAIALGMGIIGLAQTSKALAALADGTLPPGRAA
jgi:hypothetical protein